MRTIEATYLADDGGVLEGKVRFTATTVEHDGSIRVLPAPVTAIVEAGVMSISLRPDRYYLVEEFLKGAGTPFLVHLPPGADPINLTDLTIVAPPDSYDDVAAVIAEAVTADLATLIDDTLRGHGLIP